MAITIKAARVNIGLTQEELAEKMGVSRSTVLDWENGKRLMRPAYLRLFCYLTKLHEDDIIMPKINA